MPINVGGYEIDSFEARQHQYDGIVRGGLVLQLDAGIFNKVTGTTWFDLSGNSNNGTLTNGPTFNSGNGGYISFDGANDYVNLGNSFTNGYIDITASIWYYPTTTSSTQYFFSKYPGVNGWLMYYSTSGNFGVDGRESSATYFSNISTTSHSINNWYNIVFTKSATNWRLYVNGVLEINNTNGNGTTPFNNTGLLAINFLSVNSAYSFGRCSNAKIYNRALSSTEITQNYNALKGRYGL